MAYISTTKTYSVSDSYKGTSGGTSFTRTVTANLSVTVDASGNGTWSIKMTNDGSSGYYSMSFRFIINGKTLYDAWYSTSVTANQTKFPCKNNSTASGTFTTTNGSFNITLGIIAAQSGYDENAYRWNDSSFATVKTYTFTRDTRTQVTGGTINYITDNGDNTFSIKGTIGTAGASNPVTSAKLWWGWRNDSDTGWVWSSQDFSSTASGTTSIKNNIKPPIRDEYAGTQQVVASVQTFGTYSVDGSTNAESEYKYLNLKQYVAPEGPTYILVTTIDSDTLKADCTWQIHWMPGTPYNNNAAVENYYISILKNGDPVDLVDAYGAYFGTKFSVESLSEADNYFMFNPAVNGFKAGDDIQVLVSAYIVDEKYNVYESWPCYSNIYVIENDTNAYIKVDSTWKPAVLYTRVGTDWKKVDEIFKLPIDDGWLG